MISTLPPPRSKHSAGAGLDQHAARIGAKISRASSRPSMTSTETPASASMRSTTASPLDALRIALVAQASDLGRAGRFGEHAEPAHRVAPRRRPRVRGDEPFAAHDVAEAQHLLLADERLERAVGAHLGDDEMERVRCRGRPRRSAPPERIAATAPPRTACSATVDPSALKPRGPGCRSFPGCPCPAAPGPPGSVSSVRPRGGRRHPAALSRVVSAGLSLAGMVGIIGVLAATAPASTGSTAAAATGTATPGVATTAPAGATGATAATAPPAGAPPPGAPPSGPETTGATSSLVPARSGATPGSPSGSAAPVGAGTPVAPPAPSAAPAPPAPGPAPTAPATAPPVTSPPTPPATHAPPPPPPPPPDCCTGGS